MSMMDGVQRQSLRGLLKTEPVLPLHKVRLVKLESKLFFLSKTKKSQIDKGNANCLTPWNLRPLGVALAPAEVELRRPGASGALPQASPVATKIEKIEKKMENQKRIKQNL